MKFVLGKRKSIFEHSTIKKQKINENFYIKYVYDFSKNKFIILKK